ncbi:MAG: hypothetical protein HYT70_01940 [Candidatus Aenigmarchaeota archaeon]|nr:hypothetical protein [Candidatus Aenigmarchaeota archaeon]
METNGTFDLRFPPPGYSIEDSGYKRRPEIISLPGLEYQLVFFVPRDPDYPQGTNIGRFLKILECYPGEFPKIVRSTSVDPGDMDYVTRIMLERGYAESPESIRWMATYREKYTKPHSPLDNAADTVYEAVRRFIDANGYPAPSYIRTPGVGRKTKEEALEMLVADGRLKEVSRDGTRAYALIEDMKELMETYI